MPSTDSQRAAGHTAGPLQRVVTAVSTISHALSVLAQVALASLVIVMLYEVVSRYVFNRPSLWAFDISFMLNASLLMLAASWALAQGVHVRIDILSKRLARPVQRGIEVVVFGFMVVPSLYLILSAGVLRLGEAVRKGEVEQMSAWGPQVWPFFAVMVLGCAALTAQCVAVVLSQLTRDEDVAVQPRKPSLG